MGLVSLFFFSCSKNDLEKTPSFEFVTSEYSINSDGGELLINFSCTADWTVTSLSDWIQIAQNTGVSGSNKLLINISANENIETRVGKIVLISGKISETLTIWQEQKDVLTVSVDTVKVGSIGGQSVISLYSNLNYITTLSDFAESWVSVERTQTSPNDTIRVNISENEQVTPRFCTLQFSGGNINREVFIYQEGCIPFLTISDDKYLIGRKGKIFNINVDCNIDYSVSTNADWVSISPYDDYCSVTVGDNTTYEDRCATIEFKNEKYGIVERIQILQEKNIYIIPEQNQYSLSYTDMNLEIPVSSNVKFTTLISADWIHLDTSRGVPGQSIFIIVDKNRTESRRECSIQFLFEECVNTIMLKQDGMPSEFSGTGSGFIFN